MTDIAEAVGLRSGLDGVTRTITFSAPERGNRLTVAAMRAFIAALEEAHRDGALVLVVRGEGADFCLGRLQGETVEGLSRVQSLRLILEANRLLRTFPGVSIAVVRGRAYGFGAGVALQCDITVAEADARFAFDEVEHGLAPLVVAEYLPRYVGPKRAQLLVLTGREVDAATAADWGMVTDVVPAGEGDDAVAGVAERLRGSEPGALRLMKRYARALREGELLDPEGAAVDRLDEWLASGRPATVAW